MASKKITDYFEAKLSEIKPLVTLDFDVHLYFVQNQHMMVLLKKNETPTSELLQKYRTKGLDKIWIHKNDLEIYKKYTESRSKEGALLNALLHSSELGVELQKAAGKEIARVLLNTAAQATTVEEQEQNNKKMFKTIQDILEQTALQSESLVSEILKLCDVDPVLEHAANVATYAVVFAMAFGKIEPDLLADIALAGLLHDVGVSQIPFSIVLTPWKAMDREILKEYSSHVGLGLKLINEFSLSIPSRVKTLIEQHHEKFDGTGYPNGLKSFQFNDIAQLVSMADLIDSISAGFWDGQKRTLKEAIGITKQLGCFNPEVFGAVEYWISKTQANDSFTKVTETVSTQAKYIKHS